MTLLHNIIAQLRLKALSLDLLVHLFDPADKHGKFISTMTAGSTRGREVKDITLYVLDQTTRYSIFPFVESFKPAHKCGNSITAAACSGSTPRTE